MGYIVNGEMGEVDETNDKPNVGDLVPHIVPSLNDSLENKGIVFLLDRDNNEKHSVEYCTKLILDLSTSPGIEVIQIFINCSGGGVTDFLGLHDMILIAKKRYKKEIHAIVCGLAASGAALVLQAADIRAATKNSMIMLHEVSAGAEGTSSTIDDEYGTIKQFEKIVFKIWADAMGITITELKDSLKKKDVYYSAKQAQKSGLIDKVI